MSSVSSPGNKQRCQGFWNLNINKPGHFRIHMVPTLQTNLICHQNEIIDEEKENRLQIWQVSYYSNIFPQTQDDEINLNLETRSRSRPEGWDFVKISASWPSDETDQRWRVSCWRWCRMKWQSISICLVRSWKTSLSAI